MLKVLPSPPLAMDFLKDASSFEQVVSFVQLARGLKPEIQLLRKDNSTEAPVHLPPSALNILQSGLKKSEDHVKLGWEALKHIIWEDSDRPLSDSEATVFQTVGPTFGDLSKSLKLSPSSLLPAVYSY